MSFPDLIVACDTELQWLMQLQQIERADSFNVINGIKQRLLPLAAHAALLAEVEPPVGPEEIQSLWLPRNAAVTKAITWVKKMRAWASAPAIEKPDSVTPPEQASPVARAIALMVDAQRRGRPIPQVQTLATLVGCDRSTLFRDRQFKAARQAAVAPASPPPRGRRTDFGDIEAESD